MSGRSEEWWSSDHPVDRMLQQQLTPSAVQAAARAAIAAAASFRSPTEDDRKAFATAQARLALKGFELVAMPGGGYVSQQWGHVRALADMAAVEAFVRQVGA